MFCIWKWLKLLAPILIYTFNMLTSVFINADSSFVTTENFRNAAPISGSSFDRATLPSRSKARTKHISLSTWMFPELFIAFDAFLSFVSPSRSNSKVCEGHIEINILFFQKIDKLRKCYKRIAICHWKLKRKFIKRYLPRSIDQRDEFDLITYKIAKVKASFSIWFSWNSCLDYYSKAAEREYKFM